MKGLFLLDKIGKFILIILHGQTLFGCVKAVLNAGGIYAKISGENDKKEEKTEDTFVGFLVYCFWQSKIKRNGKNFAKK